MNVTDLVSLVRDQQKLARVLSVEFQGIDPDQIDVYVRGELQADSQVRLFDAEQIPNQLELQLEGEIFINLFPLHMIREFVEAFSENEASDARRIAQSLIDFRQNDA